MPKLNDTQTILLSTASQREDGNLYPLPASYAAGGVTVTKAINTLVKADLIEKRGDDAVFITAAGLAAIGVTEGSQVEDAPTTASAEPKARLTKANLVVDLLKREHGANLADLMAATNWLPHTTRAAITALRKKGHAVERFKRDDVTHYRIAG